MNEGPLARPGPDSRALHAFLEHFRIDRESTPEELLSKVSLSFAQIPYENLTKIIKERKSGSPERARRWPLEVVSDHISLGAGGTCFSLTSTLLHLLRALGWRAEPILADRKYGPNTHCAVVAWIDGSPHLIDPGFLIVRPISLESETEARIQTSFNEVVLTRREGGKKLDLHTIQQGTRTHRLTFKTAPADPGEFLKAWDESFGWDMMRYPLLTRVEGGRQLYLQAQKHLVRSRERVQKSEVSTEELPRLIAREFGVKLEVAAAALEILKRKGELRASAPAP